MMRLIPNDRRLGSAQETAEEQSLLARAVCRDHFARMLLNAGGTNKGTGLSAPPQGAWRGELATDVRPPQ
jgi:hypothetical protein